MSETPSTQALVDLIEHKNTILNRIYRLVDTQVETVNDSRIADLMPLLSKKQELLDEMNRVERELDPYRQEDPDQRQWSSDDARSNCAAMVDANRLLLSNILEKEQACEQELIQQREATAKKLDESMSAASAIESYQQFKKPTRGSLDLSSEA